MKSESEALFIATLLRHAVTATNDSKARARLVKRAGQVGRQSLGRRAITAGCLYDRGAARSTIDLLRLVAERAEQRGKLIVTESILESLSMLPDLTDLDVGRILADRARNSWKRGYVDLSAAQYEELLRRGRRQREFELQARAWIGLAAVAQVRGNFPAMRRLALRGVRLASKEGLNRLAAGGEAGLGVQAWIAGEFSASVEHLWRGYRLARGDPRLEPELLTNLANAFHESSRPVEARAAAGAVLRSSADLRIALPALGVFALSSAALGDRAAVAWSAKQTVKLARVRGYARAIAGTLFDCATAYAMIGQLTRSGVLERRAQAIAIKHGFNDLSFRETSRETRPPRQVTLARRAAAVASEVAKLGSDEAMPSDLELATDVEA